MNISKKSQGAVALVVMLPLILGLSGCYDDQPVAGARIKVTDSSEDASRKQLLFTSKDMNITTPEPQTPGDPTMYGGYIQLYNPDTGETAIHFLPEKHWAAVPVYEPKPGYRYVDVDHESGPCEYVSVTDGDRLVATCSGAEMQFSLDEPQQQALAINVVLGPLRGTRYCAFFGGDVMRDRPLAGTGIATFLAKDAPAPTSCDPASDERSHNDASAEADC